VLSFDDFSIQKRIIVYVFDFDIFVNYVYSRFSLRFSKILNTTGEKKKRDGRFTKIKKIKEERRKGIEGLRRRNRDTIISRLYQGLSLFK